MYIVTSPTQFGCRLFVFRIRRQCVNKTKQTDIPYLLLTKLNAFHCHLTKYHGCDLFFLLEWLFLTLTIHFEWTFWICENSFSFFIVNQSKLQQLIHRVLFSFSVCICGVFLFWWMPFLLNVRWTDQRFSVYMIDSLFMIVVHHHVLFHWLTTDQVFYMNRLLSQQLWLQLLYRFIVIQWHRRV